MHPKTYFESDGTKPQAGKCFVLMPFVDTLTEVYDTIREAVQAPELGFVCQRADDILGPGHIMESVLKGIAESEIVIADLTTRNPNVFYELGIAHMAKPVDKVILLIQESETPFDLTEFRHIQYKQSIAGARKLHTDLVSAVKEVADLLTLTGEGGHPIYEFKLRPGDYKFPKQLFGEDNCLYDFTMVGDYIGADGVKFRLTVTRYAAGASPKQLDTQSYGMSKGVLERIPKIPWNLSLETLSAEAATFRLMHA